MHYQAVLLPVYINGALGRNRTGTEFEVRRILSPVRLPVSPPGHFAIEIACIIYNEFRRFATLFLNYFFNFLKYVLYINVFLGNFFSKS